MGLMLACGHAANATTPDGSPCCAICAGLTEDATRVAADPPSLAGRESRCTYCKSTAPSSADLPFFEYRGEGSRVALDSCTCGYSIVAHERKQRGERVVSAVCDNFTPRGAWEYDTHYDGCRGWD